MKKSIISVFATLFLVAVRLQAQNSIDVIYSGGSGPPNMVDSTGSPLPVNTGLTVQVGYFDLTSAQIQASANDLSILGPNWHMFGGTSISTTVLAPLPGSFSGDNQVFDPNTAGFAGKQIDLWVFLTTDGSTPTANFSNVLEYGLYTALGNSSWLFPSSGIAAQTTIDTSQITTVYYGGQIPATGTATSYQLAQVAAVPEPNSIALFGFGLALWSELFPAVLVASRASLLR